MSMISLYLDGKRIARLIVFASVDALLAAVKGGELNPLLSLKTKEASFWMENVVAVVATKRHIKIYSSSFSDARQAVNHVHNHVYKHPEP